jgi:CubicO group peptidase (beta-lactamase class C family)
MLAFVAVLVAAAQQPLPSDSTVRAIITDRVPALHGAGIVVGLFGPDDERRVVAAGVAADRVFEIGAITNVFSAAMLAQMAATGALQQGDPIATYLSAHEDSSAGIGPLGEALVQRSGRKYEDLVRQHILWPLGMRETAIALVPDLRSRLAPGHDGSGQVIPNRDFLIAGALRSTVKDMLTFLMTNVDSATTPIARALHQRLSWHTLAGPGGGGTIVWHDGGTAGYHAYIGFDPVRGVGVVVLSNSSVEMNDIGFHLLDETFPLKKTSPSASPP